MLKKDDIKRRIKIAYVLFYLNGANTLFATFVLKDKSIAIFSIFMMVLFIVSAFSLSAVVEEMDAKGIDNSDEL